jgi:hypothetical protein
VFGFNAPILVDKDNQIVAGHARHEAAKLSALAEVPVIRLDHLTEAQINAYMIADNKLTDRSYWDDDLLASHFKELSALAIDFEIEDTGFEPPEIDLLIHSHDEPDAAEKADEFEFAAGTAVSELGDLWSLDTHRLYCGNSVESSSYRILFGGEKAATAFTDPPYNVKIRGHVSGKGRINHREFPMASGEMSEAEFTDFLTISLSLICGNTVRGALIYTCMDWRHLQEMLAAGRASRCDHINVCVWVKNNGAMGSLYRSRHELVLVFRNGTAGHVNNVQLGRFGRNRTNVWHYAGANSFARKGSRRNLDLHPTAKPIRMVADAILDSSNRDDIVLDPFLGSGTTLLAAERTNRRCYSIEFDPLYVDTAIERWQQMTGRKASNREGETFDSIKTKRRGNE